MAALTHECHIRSVGSKVKLIPYITLDGLQREGFDDQKNDEIKFAALKRTVVECVKDMSSKYWCYTCRSKGIHTYIHTYIYTYILIHTYILIRMYMYIRVDTIPFFIGKKGEKINQLRKEFKHVSVEIGTLKSLYVCM